MFGLVDAGPGARVLVKADGKPYITSKIVGAGEVVLVTGSLDDRWGSFSSDPGSFHVPFANFILRHLTSLRKVPGGTRPSPATRSPWLAPARSWGRCVRVGHAAEGQAGREGSAREA